MQGIPSRAVLVSALLLTACSGPRAPTMQGGGAIVTHDRPCAVRAPGWLELRDLSVHTDAEKDPPREPYVRGVWVGGFFDATGDVAGPVGDPPKGRSLTRGYLELRTRAFYRATDERKRTPPWIEGSRDDDSGGFFPASSVSWSSP
jgi:hypothetical protein